MSKSNVKTPKLQILNMTIVLLINYTEVAKLT